LEVFALAQHLALDGAALRSIPLEMLGDLLTSLELITADKASYIWLQAYENHYRDEVFSAVVQNHGRGRWATRATRPVAQVVFCMDDREEGVMLTIRDGVYCLRKK